MAPRVGASRIGAQLTPKLKKTIGSDAKQKTHRLSERIPSHRRGKVNSREMGRIYLEHIGGKRLFSCAQCDTFLTNRNELISTRFTGATGRAFLFNKVVNLRYR